MIRYLCQYRKLNLSIDEPGSCCLKVEPESRCKGGKAVRIALLQVAILKSTVTETMAVFILEMTLAGRRP